MLTASFINMLTYESRYDHYQDRVSCGEEKHLAEGSLCIPNKGDLKVLLERTNAEIKLFFSDLAEEKRDKLVSFKGVQ